MQWYSRSILNRILSVVLAINLLIAAVAGYYFVYTIEVKDSYSSLASDDLGQAITSLDVLTEFKTQVQEWKNVLIRGGDASQREKYWARFKDSEANIQDELKSLIPEVTNAEAKSLLQRFQSAHRKMGDSYREGYQSFINSGFDASAGDTAVQGIDREPAELIEKATESIRKAADAHLEKLNEEVTDRTFFTGSLLMLAIVTGTIVCVLVLLRSIITPTRTLIANIQKLGNGDTTEAVTIKRSDELGRLADAARQLHEFLVTTSILLSDNAGKLDTTRATIRDSADQVSDRSQDAHERIDQIATAMNEMSATAQDVAQHAATVASQVQETSAQTDDADQQIHKAVNSMERLIAQIKSSSETVARLADSSQKVGKVMEVIREIADQTNLLALNAAIEAARAGEAGRGFAVVADEVRTLASKTQDATVEIDKIIESISSGSRDAVEFMQASEIVGQESSEAVIAVRQTLGGIHERMTRINEATVQVATAAEEQTSVCEEINRNVSDVAEISVTMSEVAQSNLATVPELEQMAQEANQLAARIKR
ncbi:MAG: methyl-accepting chemotaxis protein [Alteromonadaceae bacterium]|nr:methyl-accepting chemotaxis protein [Alteromonadaceae bacterium]MBH84447.1 methyl-accepting chemotaxis protein [Alteromonadaceae bacterium]|tara:strand:+ start:4774 stop:6399 length:1626 start_codon:yes stop_codon:yes gene_type:complete